MTATPWLLILAAVVLHYVPLQVIAFVAGFGLLCAWTTIKAGEL